MSDLQNQAPANTYKGLLQVGDYTNGVDANSEYILDGKGTPSVLSISTTKVGVGTVSPSAELDVVGGIEATTLTTSGAVTAGSVSTSGAVGAGSIDVSGNVVADEYALDQTGSSSSAVAIHAPTTNELAIRTNSAERVRIDSSGNVGIGTESPDGKLEVNSDDFDTLYLNRNINTGSATIILKNNGGSGGAVQSLHGGGLKFLIRNSSGALTPTMQIDSAGNVGIGTDSFGANAASVLGIKNGTAPTDSPADMVQLYAKDDAGSSRLYVRNEAGTETVLSPHAADAPSSLYDRPPGVEEMHRSANYYLGTIVFTNVDRRNALMQKQLNGEELPEDRTFTITETFAEYNDRTGADLQVEDWDANQQAIFDAQEEKVLARQAEIDAWDNEEEEAPEPLQSYVKKPKPEWLS